VRVRETVSGDNANSVEIELMQTSTIRAVDNWLHAPYRGQSRSSEGGNFVPQFPQPLGIREQVGARCQIMPYFRQNYNSAYIITEKKTCVT